MTRRVRRSDCNCILSPDRRRLLKNAVANLCFDLLYFLDRLLFVQSVDEQIDV